jgi:outer membrane biogenesis lipoprotein LolB
MKNNRCLLSALILAGCATTATTSPEQKFKKADTNKDGQLTLAEYQSYLARRDAAIR